MNVRALGIATRSPEIRTETAVLSVGGGVMATQPIPAPIREGYDAALERVTRAGLFDGGLPEEAKQAARLTLEEGWTALGGDEPDRYVALYSEVVAVGAFARVRYGEQPLNSRELMALHEVLAPLLNSWVHRHGGP
ncbi:MAG TPA: hypothetical protein VF712_13860 [Thermoleophilaceae bacterium]